MDKVLFPGSVRGQVDIPASKSQTIHALLIALFAKGVSTIHNPLICSDTQACLDFCVKLGARIEYADDTITIDSSDLSPEGSLEVNCRNSGTTLFFATALGSTLDTYLKFTGDESLEKRPARALLSSLADLGAKTDTKVEFAPYGIHGPLFGGHTSIRCVTGQYLTALLLAAPLARTDTTIDVHLLKEKTAVRMTEIWMENQNIHFFRDNDMRRYTIKGGQSYRPFERDMNGDFSLAAFFFCAAAITAGTVTVTGIDADSSQADRKILNILSDMGCSVSIQHNSVTLTGPSRLKAMDIDLGDTPDLLPALAVTSCFASGPVTLSNIGQGIVKGTKERTSSIADGIRTLGGQVRVLHDSMVVFPTDSFAGDVKVNSFGDPRTAMAMAVASLRCRGSLTIKDCTCVDETFPGFFRRFSGINTTGERNVQDSFNT